MKKLFLLLGTTAFCAATFAQPSSEATIYKTSTPPTIDGVANDAVWSAAEQHDNASVYNGEADGFTGPEDFASYWKACWNDTGVFVLVNVTADDVHYSLWSNGADWQTDISEVYFDMNSANLADGKGPSTAASGHYQFAGRSTSDSIIKWGTKSWKYTKVTDPLYVQELYIAWADLADADGNVLASPADVTVGFDVMMADNDGVDNNRGGTDPRSRMVWANDGTGPSTNEDWNNMDDAGKLTFSTSNAISTVKAPSFSVYPNPTADVLRFSNNVNNVVVTDVLGKEVLRASGVNSKSINVAVLRKGVYFVTVDSKYTSKFVKR